MRLDDFNVSSIKTANVNKNYSKQIIWRELNRAVC